jgi:two-component system cell cycle response regulator
MRVLIADDDNDTTTTLAILARSWGYDPVTAGNGHAALDILNGPQPPHLAMLDWFMPGLNGIDICREIRKGAGRPYTYCVLVTGRGGKREMLGGLEAGADDYLIKPVDPSELCARLRTGQRIVELQDQLLASHRLLRQQVARDGLTGLWNRNTVLELLDAELDRSRREGHPLTILMADIDHFKGINDTFSHLAGDQVLRQTAQRLLAGLRPYDCVGRYGGEEFLAVLPGCDADAGLALAERLRRCVAEEPMQDEGRDIPVTLSLGAAAWDGKMPATALLRWADETLYRAKRAGRNRALGAAAPLERLVS